MSHQIDGRIFSGVMDKDSDPTLVSIEDYIDAQDILNGYGETVGVIVFPKGNTQIPYTLPAGTNLCMGTCEDKENSCLIFFFYNTSDDHQIIKWNSITGEVVLLAQGEALNFSDLRRITHSIVVDGHLLYWTDAATWGGDIVGNWPMMLDMDKANPNKQHTFDIISSIGLGAGQFNTGYTYEFSITDQDGTNPTDTFTFTADGAFAGDYAGGLVWLEGEIEAAYGDLVNVEDCNGCKLTLEVQEETKRITMVASAGDLLLVPNNCYPAVLEDQHIDMLKPPGKCAPLVSYEADPSYPANNVSQMCAQFIVRTIFCNGERSAWSPVSNIALNLGIDGEPILGLNTIKIDINDARLFDPSWLSIITAVEVGFRNGNTDNYKLIDRYLICDLSDIRTVVFKNDKLYTEIPSDEAAAGDVQALKPFDHLPTRVGTLEASADDSGSSIIFMGATEEGFECPDCVDLTVEVEEATNECLINIKGKIVIINDADFPDDMPDYDHYPLNGFVVYLTGTNYYAISDNPAGVSLVDATGEFTIKNVPRGKYVLRVASFRCNFGSELSPRYDLNNGLEWQRTSSPLATGNIFVNDTNVDGGALDGISEFLIDTSDSGTVPGPDFDLTSVYSPNGNIFIYNQHFSRLDDDPGNDRVDLREIYIIDNEGLDTDLETRIGALNCERQEGNISGADPQTPALPINYNFVSDHNGYVHFRSHAEDTFGLWLMSVVDSVSPAAALYKGDYDAMYADTLTLMPTLETDGPGVYFWVNKDLDFTARKRSMEVFVEDVNGAPVQGAIVVYESTTRTVKTGTDGSGSIIMYGPSGAILRDDDFLVVNYGNDNCYEYYPALNPIGVVWEIGIQTPFIADPFIFSFVAGVVFGQRYFKGGGVYDLGIVYEDRGNRTCGAVKGTRLEMPYHTAPVGFLPRRVIWSINSIPPDWATHYRLVRSRNAIQAYYVQWGVKTVIYARIPSQLENPIITSYLNGDYTHIFLELYVPPAIPATGAYYLPFKQEDGQYSYQPAEGDRVRFILDDEGNPLTNGVNYLEAPVVGKYVDGDKIYAVIENQFGNTEVKANWLAEYYQPGPGIEDIFYEGGNDCYDILNPGLPNRTHAGPLQSQSGGFPAKGYYTMGDTYWRRDAFTGSSSLLTEHQSPHSVLVGACEDIGRAFVADPDAGQVFHKNRIRFSGRLIQNSMFNGLSSFRGLDYKDINKQWGIITWLGFANNVLLAVCRHKIQPVYVNKHDLLSLTGATTVGRSDKILEVAEESIMPYGTHNPESVVRFNNYVYGWDKYNGVVWRYASNGVEAITTKMVNYFRQKGVERMIAPGDSVIGGFDRRHGMYMLTFVGAEVLSFDTLSYDEIKGGWSSRHSFIPDCYGMVGQEMITVDGNGIWQHFQNSLYSNYYGAQKKPSVKIPFNRDPAATKIWWSIRVMANRQFESSSILVPFNSDYAAGMQSRLNAIVWNSYEGAWRADFMRDMLDTSAEFLSIPSVPLRQKTALLRGRRLRGEVIIVTLRAVDGSLATALRRVDATFTYSNVTNQ